MKDHTVIDVKLTYKVRSFRGLGYEGSEYSLIKRLPMSDDVNVCNNVSVELHNEKEIIKRGRRAGVWYDHERNDEHSLTSASSFGPS